MSVATKSSDSEDWTFGVNLQTDGHILKPSEGQMDPEEIEALGSAPSHSPSWSPARRPFPSHLSTRHSLGIQVTLTKKTGAEPPPPHTRTVPLVEDMLCHGRTGLTEAVVTGPGKAVLFYGRWSLGEGLSLGKARDATFTLMGVGTWVGKPAYLATDPLTIQEGQWTIVQAITECQIEVRGPGQTCLQPSTPQPFRFHCLGDSPQKDCPGDTSFGHQLLLHRQQRGQDWDWCRRDQRLIPPQLPSPSLDHDSKVIGVQCWQPHQCCHCQIGWKAPGDPNKADDEERLGPHEDYFNCF